MDLRPPEAVRRLARRLERAGYETWAVGGAVRDHLAGLPAGDWDLATRARPHEVIRLFRRTVPVGIDHGTVGVLDGDRLYEVTTFRRDVETFGRHAVVEFADTVEEDLSRRDFTINAVAWHPLTGELLDPFGGRRDLRDKLLRTVGEPEERFAEDYLRVLRALRFAGQFELAIEPGTWDALRKAVPRLSELSAERVREELMKVLSQARRPSIALDLYRTSGVLGALYPELAALPREQPTPGGDDLWTVTLRAVDAIPSTRPILRLTALLHAVGMPASRTPDPAGGWRYPGHGGAGARAAEDIMRRLKASNADTDRTVRLVRHQPELFPPGTPDAGVRRWLRTVGTDLVHDLFRLRIALCRARHPRTGEPEPEAGHGEGAALLDRWGTVRRVLRDRPPLAVTDLAIGGADLQALGLQPGPIFGKILAALLDRVTDDPTLNRREALLDLVRREWLHE